MWKRCKGKIDRLHRPIKAFWIIGMILSGATLGYFVTFWYFAYQDSKYCYSLKNPANDCYFWMKNEPETFLPADGYWVQLTVGLLSIIFCWMPWYSTNPIRHMEDEQEAAKKVIDDQARIQKMEEKKKKMAARREAELERRAKWIAYYQTHPNARFSDSPSSDFTFDSNIGIDTGYSGGCHFSGGGDGGGYSGGGDCGGGGGGDCGGGGGGCD
ncbi:hypothetical protein SAMD00019534_105060 [Acytostelium subglobosum LB1]|uniref:hypothetical protein n=1 Tax=Acytostelium subglobosum LB1 TaxID=1410327 RepID=UPI0006451AD1|nr:hypothetical protein SAMD00019534_105060 [Acytostelium subglobosum LB1]GAM27331.1 hypothetical protein SAMD00019534_105060 [Acytostelium subglobosum LB1]|eukprot:XP_012749798.1 hypothetical protein SAMD00019534_105060 [Acytostelium subglobosum LB1]